MSFGNSFMDQIEIKDKKLEPLGQQTTRSKKVGDIVCGVCGRKITKGEWITKNILTDRVICEDCGEGVIGESFFSVDE